MRPTPFGRLLARGLRGRCPVCARGPLFKALYTLREYCPACGYRYHRAIEYGSEGYLSGAVSLNVMLTGGVLAAVLIYLAATDAGVPVAVQFVAGAAWTIAFPLLFHRAAIGIWIALDLRLNPPAPHELAAAPPRREQE
jgi:uncharacterized protein (DUF983 family)